MGFLLFERKSLTDTERRVLELLVAGDDPVLERLRQQVPLITSVDRIRLGGGSLATGRDLAMALEYKEKPRSLSVTPLSLKLPGFADLMVVTGGSEIRASVRVRAGFLSSMQLREHKGRVPNALRRPLKGWGYKTCEHWEDPWCDHVPDLAVRERPPLRVAERFPPRDPSVPRPPRWLRRYEDDIEGQEGASEEDLAALAARAEHLPADLLELLGWSDGLELEQATLLSAREMYFLDEDEFPPGQLVIATDISGDVYVLDMQKASADVEPAVFHYRHDPPGRRRSAPKLRAWVTKAARGEL